MVLKFPPAVLNLVVQTFPIVQQLPMQTETQLMERFLSRYHTPRWHALFAEMMCAIR